MSLLDDVAVFTAVIQYGGFSRAAKQLGLSNGLVSRRIAQLERQLGVSLIKRTTRQNHLTPEGELLWQHSSRIQQELDSALSLIQSSAKKPKGSIRISAPMYFGRHFLTPILMKFLNDFPEIKIELVLSNQRVDILKEKLDLVFRGAGFVGEGNLKDSGLQMKQLLKDKIGLYASPQYLLKHGEPKTPEDLTQHATVLYSDSQTLIANDVWKYQHKNKSGEINVHSTFSCNDMESVLFACIQDAGIGRFTELHVKGALQQQTLRPILTEYDWGSQNLFVIFARQQALPKRVRVLLDFISAYRNV